MTAKEKKPKCEHCKKRPVFMAASIEVFNWDHDRIKITPNTGLCYECAIIRSIQGLSAQLSILIEAGKV